MLTFGANPILQETSCPVKNVSSSFLSGMPGRRKFGRELAARPALESSGAERCLGDRWLLSSHLSERRRGYVLLCLPPKPGVRGK